MLTPCSSSRQLWVGTRAGTRAQQCGAWRAVGREVRVQTFSARQRYENAWRGRRARPEMGRAVPCHLKQLSLKIFVADAASPAQRNADDAGHQAQLPRRPLAPREETRGAGGRTCTAAACAPPQPPRLLLAPERALAGLEHDRQTGRHTPTHSETHTHLFRAAAASSVRCGARMKWLD